MTLIKSVMAFLRRYSLIDPPHMPKAEINPVAHDQGWETWPDNSNPFSDGSVLYRSWDQGFRDRAAHERTLW